MQSSPTHFTCLAFLFLSVTFTSFFTNHAAAAATAAAAPSTHYNYLNYDQIVSSLRTLQTKYPNTATLSNAQETYQVPSPGKCGDAPCKQWYLTLNDDQNLPEVFFSGAVHGNERVGPTTTVELVRFLLPYSTSNDQQQQQQQQQQHKEGKEGQALARWLSRLINTRSITIMPTANALGYYQNVREENDVDPNRDFPWGVAPEECMKTTAARALNSLWREHLFQLSITFHGGMRAFAYEWGSPNYKDASPDDAALQPLGQYAVRAAGVGDGRHDGYYYPASWLNPLVYPVKGGMEDWAYAASFDTTGYNVPCQPAEYGGYPKEMTVYGTDQLRTFNFLVETADDKTPEETMLGLRLSQPLDIMNTKSTDEGLGGGHVPRNMRLMLFMIDLVEPYIEWFHVDATDDPIEHVLEQKQDIYRWDVGGALRVDDTALFVLPRLSSDKCPVHARLLDMAKATRMDVTAPSRGDEEFGQTIWSKTEEGNDSDGNVVHFVGRYSAALTTLPPGTAYVVVAGAKVDQAWTTPTQAYEPTGMAPQSHVVQARTSDTYRAVNGRRKITGHVWWYSTPVCVDLDGGGGGGGGGSGGGGGGATMERQRKSDRLRRSMMRGNTWLTRV